MKSIKITGNLYKAIVYLQQYIRENTTCKVNESENNYDILIILEQSDDNSPYYNISDNTVAINLAKDIINEDYFKAMCKQIFLKFDIESLDYDIKPRSIHNISDIEDKLSANYDKENDRFSKMKNEGTVDLQTVKRAKTNNSSIYVVRRRFLDDESTKYMGASLVKAVTECKKYSGMSVFNQNGELIFKSTRNKVTPIQQPKECITKRAKLNISTGTGIYVGNRGKRIHIPNGTEVIVSKISNSNTEIIVESSTGEKLHALVKAADLIEI